MRLYDENWNEILDHPLLDAMDQYINDLASLSKEERYQIFKDMMYREPLKYLQEIGSTTYIILYHPHSFQRERNRQGDRYRQPTDGKERINVDNFYALKC